MIKSRMMRWTGHVARMNAEINPYRILVEGRKEGKRTLEKQGVGGWIIQK
jgi:hypothetical protein